MSFMCRFFFLHKWPRWSEPRPSDTGYHVVQTRTCERCGQVQTRKVTNA